MGNVMSTVIRKRGVLLALLFVLFGALSIIAYVFREHLIRNALQCLSWFLALVGVECWARNRFPHFFALCVQIRAILLSIPTRLSATATYRGVFSPETLRDIKEILCAKATSVYLMHETENALRISVDGVNYAITRSTISDESAEEGVIDQIHVQIFDVRLSYPQALEELEERIIPLFSHIEQNVGSQSSDYSFRAVFAKGNPFVRRYLSHFPTGKLSEFHCLVEVPARYAPRNTLVSITDKSIEIMASTTSGLFDVKTVVTALGVL